MASCLLLVLQEPGQTTLDFTSRIAHKRPGKPSNPTTKIPLYRSIGARPEVGDRRWIASESAHEDVLVHQFQIARIVHYDDEESDPEGYVLHRNSYSCELKLSAIQ
jgi:hypothetical protein